MSFNGIGRLRPRPLEEPMPINPPPPYPRPSGSWGEIRAPRLAATTCEGCAAPYELRRSTCSYCGRLYRFELPRDEAPPAERIDVTTMHDERPRYILTTSGVVSPSEARALACGEAGPELFVPMPPPGRLIP